MPAESGQQLHLQKSKNPNPSKQIFENMSQCPMVIRNKQIYNDTGIPRIQD